jgi:hypothetical protein
MLVGAVVDYEPIPPIPENTRMIDAGAVSFGLEHRVINGNVAIEHYGADKFEAMREASKGVVELLTEDDTGVSIHVFGDDGLEYLRFDCFGDEPHYHYMMPHESWQRIVPFDDLAHGDILAWTLGVLRSDRLAAMLRESGASACVDRLDAPRLAGVLGEVEQLALTIARGKAVA